jgi:hypothetical protein
VVGIPHVNPHLFYVCKRTEWHMGGGKGSLV